MTSFGHDGAMIQVMTLAAMALAVSPYRPVPTEPPTARPPQPKELRVTSDERSTAPCRADKEVSGLPFARGRTFCALDDYLAHLELQGAIDLPYWRMVRPDVYTHVTSMTGAVPETATRRQLMKRFGFSR